MKKTLSVLIAVIMVFALTACGAKNSDPTLAGEILDEKSMEITANKADPDDFLLTGTLMIEDGEQVYYDHKLDAGEIEIEFIPSEEEQSIEELPDYENADPANVLHLSGNGEGSTYFGSGSYMVKVTAVGKKKTVGTVTLNIKPTEE